MGCTLSKKNKVSPLETTPSARSGRITNFKLWVGKKRRALFRRKVARNQVMPLNGSAEECSSTSSQSTIGSASCYSTRSSSSSSTTISGLLPASDFNNVETAELPRDEDRCRTRIIRKGSGSYYPDDEDSESSADSYHGNFESRETSPVLFSLPGSPIDNSIPNRHPRGPIRTPLNRLDSTRLMSLIRENEDSDLEDDEAERMLRFAKTEVEAMEQRRQRRLVWDSDEDDDERTVNLDGILTITPLRPPTSAQREVVSSDSEKSVSTVETSDEEKDEEPKYANSTEELEAVIKQTFEEHNIEMPEEEEEWKLEEKTYDDPDEELADVIQQIFTRWNITMSDEEENMPSTSSTAGRRTSQPSSSVAHGPTSALTQPRSSNNDRHTPTTEARQSMRNDRPRAAHGARTDPRGSGFELPGSAFQRKY